MLLKVIFLIVSMIIFLIVSMISILNRKCKKTPTHLLFFRYTYGKPVKGDVTLTFLPLSFWGMKKNITKKFKVTFTDVL